MIFFVKLFLAHLLGDFVLQPDSWIKDKENKKWRSVKLFIHVWIHGVIAAILVGFPLGWIVMLVIATSHWIIDLLKINFQKSGKKKKRNQPTSLEKKWFFIDQSLHILVMLILAISRQEISFTTYLAITDSVLIYMAAVIFLTTPTSIIIQLLISKWTPESTKDRSLKHAGQYIGMLERLLVFIFMVTGAWQGAGFLLAAKSIFRFGDLRGSNDRQLTEYVLIGTLLSFGIALVIGILVPYMIA